MSATPHVADLFRRFSDRSRHAVAKSESYARREGSPTVVPGHLLLGLVAADGRGLERLRAHGDVQRLVDEAVVDDAALADLPHVPYAAESKKVLEQCLVVAIAAGDDEIHTTHLVAALLDREDPDVQRVLQECGVELERLRAELPAPEPQVRASARERMSQRITPVTRPVPTEVQGDQGG